MNTWQSFLQSQQALFDISAPITSVADLDDPRRPTGTWLIDLTHLGSILVSGADAITFLGGQFTNDVRALTPNRSQLNGWCNPQGRLLALFRTTQHGDGVLLQVPRELIDPMIKRLRMFVLRSNVSLTNSSDDWASVGVVGTTALTALQGIFQTVPTQSNAVAHEHGVALIRAPGEEPRWNIVGPADAMQLIWTRLASAARPSPSSLWRLHEIWAGQPQVFAASSGEFIPQMVNLQAVGGVNFKKGCYPGQEIVARMQYLGKLKRRMTAAEFESPSAPAPGTDIVAADAPEQKVGNIVSAELTGDGKTAALAVLELAAMTQPLALAASGSRLTLAALPYDPTATIQPITAS